MTRQFTKKKREGEKEKSTKRGRTDRIMGELIKLVIVWHPNLEVVSPSRDKERERERESCSRCGCHLGIGWHLLPSQSDLRVVVVRHKRWQKRTVNPKKYCIKSPLFLIRSIICIHDESIISPQTGSLVWRMIRRPLAVFVRLPSTRAFHCGETENSS